MLAQAADALVLAGTGTAGAYQAGAARAGRAGVRIDLVAGRGWGGDRALCRRRRCRRWEPAAVTGPARPSLYPWRTIWKVVAALLALAILALAAPLLVLLVLAVAWLPAFLLELVAPPLAGRLTATLAEWAFWVTRGETATAAVSRASGAAMLVLALTILGAALLDRRRGVRRPTGAPWWQALGAPLDARPVVRWALDGFWNVMKGATASRGRGRRPGAALRGAAGQPDAAGLPRAAHRRARSRITTRPDLRAAPRGRAAALLRRRPEDQRRAEVVDLSATAAGMSSTRLPARWQCRGWPSHTWCASTRPASGAASHTASAIARLRSSACSRKCRRLAPSR
jgi:hypothetical protein